METMRSLLRRIRLAIDRGQSPGVEDKDMGGRGMGVGSGRGGWRFLWDAVTWADNSFITTQRNNDIARTRRSTVVVRRRRRGRGGRRRREEYKKTGELDVVGDPQPRGQGG